MDKLTRTARSANMRQIKSSGMKPEMIVRRLAYSLGFRYRLHRHDIPGRPDLVFPGREKIIFVHGCFWHQHKGCIKAHVPLSRREYWIPKLERNVARDSENLDRLNKLKWDVLVIWECELDDVSVVRKRLRKFLG